MVFLALVLTVSTLAILISAEPTEQLVVHHACEGEAFCAIKPENYPQEEIDRLLIKNLPQLHRMKRSVIEPAPPNPEGNCGVTDSKMTKPFTLKHENAVPKVIVQSKWFSQEIAKISCKDENSECFSMYTSHIVGLKTQCMPKKMSSSIVVFDPISKQFETENTDVEVDCACVIKNA